MHILKLIPSKIGSLEYLTKEVEHSFQEHYEVGCVSTTLVLF